MKTNLFTILLLAFLVVGCGEGKREITKQILIESFTEVGVIGEQQEKMFVLVGAIDGFGLNGEDFSVEMYKFETPELAQSCSACEFTITNENWGLYIHEDEDYSDDANASIVSVFENL